MHTRTNAHANAYKHKQILLTFSVIYNYFTISHQF